MPLALTGAILGAGFQFVNEPVGEDAAVSAVMVDAADGGVVYEQAADAPQAPGAATRLMALYLAFEGLEAGRVRLSDRLPSEAGHPPATVADGVRAMADGSAPALAAALARRLWGSEAAFVEQMSQRARALGMAHSRFVNLTGADDPRQVSSARDMASLVWSLSRDFPRYTAALDRPAGLRQTALLQVVAPAACLAPAVHRTACGTQPPVKAPDQQVIAVILGRPAPRLSDARALAHAAAVVVRQALLGRPVTLTGLPGPASPDPLRSPESSVPGESLKIVVVDPRVERAPDRLVAENDTAPLPPPPVPRPTAAPVAQVARAAPPSSAGWVIQIGAFRSADEARDQLSGLTDRLPDVLRPLPRHVERAPGGLYRARFEAPAPGVAEAACKASRARDAPAWPWPWDKPPRDERLTQGKPRRNFRLNRACHARHKGSLPWRPGLQPLLREGPPGAFVDCPHCSCRRRR